jgi:hypothetical protein
LLGFDELTEDFDRVFNDDPNMLVLLESYRRVRGKNLRKELILLHSYYTLDLKQNKNSRKIKPEEMANEPP